MPRFRPDVEEFVTPPDYRVFLPHEHATAMKISIRQALEAVRPQLEPRFKDIARFYTIALDAKAEYQALCGKSS